MVGFCRNGSLEVALNLTLLNFLNGISHLQFPELSIIILGIYQDENLKLVSKLYK